MTATQGHSLQLVSDDVLRKVASAVGRVTGHLPGGTDWDVYGCVGCAFAEVRFHSGVNLRETVNVRGWNLPSDPVYPS